MLFRLWFPGILIIVTTVLVLTACYEKQDVAASQMSKSESSLPGVRLQRVFEKVELSVPVLMLQAPGDDSHWYVVQKHGQILKISNETQQATLFAELSDRVDSGPNEAGLLGMAFHPQYETNGQVYLSYTTDDSSLTSIISRMKRDDKEDRLLVESEQILFKVRQPYSNHNGGHVAFGPDGYLYVGLGDGGSGGDPKGHGQNTQTLLGSMLRVDVNQGSPYAIPSDNPFASGEKGRAEIYAWGLRNPWRWSFDRKTGELWVADVGQNAWEEINLMTRPGNYGWNGREGTHCYQTSNCKNPEFIDPVLEYDHDEGCSVTGGYVYRGNAIKSLQGKYLYGDFCSGTIWAASKKNQGVYKSSQLLSSGLNIASFGEGNDGEVYVVNLEGELYQLVAK